VNSQVLVTVAVVTYKSSETVLETLDSIYGQTHQRIQLMIADDHSPDDTLKVVSGWIRTYGSRFENVRILKAKKNHGVTGNCNIAIHQAAGEYIQLIAGDDIMLPDAISHKVAFAEEHDLGAVFARVEPFGTDRKKVLAMTGRCNKGYGIMKADALEQRKQIAADNFVAGPSGSFYRTEFIRAFGAYDDHYKMMEDWPFIYHYLMRGYPMMLMDECVARYRVSGTSLCTTVNKDFVLSSFLFFVRERLWMLLRYGNFKTIKSNVKSYYDSFKKIMEQRG